MSADPSQAVVDLGLTGGSPPATPPRRESVARERHDSVLSSGTINKCDASSIVRFQSQYILYNVAQMLVTSGGGMSQIRAASLRDVVTFCL